jgi:hypothetical protein
LVQSILRTCHKNIGTVAEFVNEDPALAEFFLSRPEMEDNKDDSMVDAAMNVIPDMLDQGELHTVPEEQNEDSREDVDPREALPPGEADNEPPLTPEEMEKLYDQFEMEDDVNSNFDQILDYEFKDGVLLLKAWYLDDDIGEHTLTVPFPILKWDVPLEVAHFICDNVVEDKRGGYYNTWANML